MKDRFDFEQDIFICWHIIDDLKLLYEMACDKDTSTEDLHILKHTSTDDIANVVLGLQTLYDNRFHKLMDSFEHLLSVDGFSTNVNKDAKYGEMYTGLDKLLDEKIIKASMLNQYHDIKEEIESQKSVESPQEYQKEDLKYNEKFLDACITVLKHYTVYDDWPEELKDE